MFFVPRGPSRGAPEPASDAAASVRRLGQASGAGDALASIYQREAPAVYRYVLALCGNAAWAADATQEAFAELAARPQGFDPARGALGAYLAGIARHALAARRREQRFEEPLDDEGDGEPAAPSGRTVESPEAVLVRRQDLHSLWAALRALPVAFREAVVLVDLQERSYVEAAQVAGVELNTLRTRVHRGRARLAALLGRVDGARGGNSG